MRVRRSAVVDEPADEAVEWVEAVVGEAEDAVEYLSEWDDALPRSNRAADRGAGNGAGTAQPSC
jgi:hypothetical protein